MQTVSITPQSDNLVEHDEDFTVTISAPTDPEGWVVGALPSFAGTITNDDEFSVTLSSTADSLDENSGAFSFDVQLSNPVDWPVDISFALNHITTDADDIASLVPGTMTLSFAASDQAETIQVTAQADTLVENNEDFSVTLNNPTPSEG